MVTGGGLALACNGSEQSRMRSRILESDYKRRPELRMRPDAWHFELPSTSSKAPVSNCWALPLSGPVMEPSQPAQGENIAAVLYGVDDLRVEPFPISGECWTCPCQSAALRR